MTKLKYLAILSFFMFTSCKRITFDAATNPEIKIKSGEKFSLHLPENHSKGINWQLDDNYNKDLLDYTNSLWEGNSRGVNFLFQATQKGETKLLFKERTFNEFTDSVFVKVAVE